MSFTIRIKPYRWRTLIALATCLVVAVFGESASAEDNIVAVTLSNGANVRGRLQSTAYAGKVYAAFKGIPYAEAPVGELRFKAPAPIASVPDHVDAFEYGNICPHFDDKTASEDCLFLNIFTPDVKPTEKLPVMFFIHGGGFFEGSGNDDLHGPDFLVEENVIVVTINYRLGIFGFLSLATAEYSGNMGLKDQQLAMRWVKENIEQFGGNPEEITIFGHSAGGTSVHLHALVESSSGLFKRVIAMSGTAENAWAIQGTKEQLLPMFAFARQYDQTISTYPALLKWLTEAPTSILLNSIDPRFNADTVESDLELVWAPVAEHKRAAQPFLQTLNPLEDLKINVDIMFGVTSSEWLFLLSNKLADPSKLEPLDEDFNIILPWKQWAKYRDTEHYSTMLDEIRTFYFGEDSTIDADTLTELSTLMSDIAFGYGIHKSVQKHAATSAGKTFYYRFSVEGKLNFLKELSNTTSLPGASHADELCYLFKCKAIADHYDLPADSVERSVQKNIVKLWTNFAKHGHPSPNGEPISLTPVTPNDMHFVDIRNEGLVTGLGPSQKYYTFWDELFVKYSKLFGETDGRDEL